LKIKTDRLRLPEIRKQKNFNKLRQEVTTSSSRMSTSITKAQVDRKTAQTTIKLLSPRI
jgi:hypothetical protein